MRYYSPAPPIGTHIDGLKLYLSGTEEDRSWSRRLFLLAISNWCKSVILGRNRLGKSYLRRDVCRSTSQYPCPQSNGGSRLPHRRQLSDRRASRRLEAETLSTAPSLRHIRWTEVSGRRRRRHSTLRTGRLRSEYSGTRGWEPFRMATAPSPGCRVLPVPQTKRGQEVARGVRTPT